MNLLLFFRYSHIDFIRMHDIINRIFMFFVCDFLVFNEFEFLGKFFDDVIRMNLDSVVTFDWGKIREYERYMIALREFYTWSWTIIWTEHDPSFCMSVEFFIFFPFKDSDELDWLTEVKCTNYLYQWREFTCRRTVYDETIFSPEIMLVYFKSFEEWYDIWFTSKASIIEEEWFFHLNFRAYFFLFLWRFYG